jgi:hypothetical protein
VASPRRAGVAGLLAILAAILLLRHHRQRRRHFEDDIMGNSSSKDRAASLLSGSRDGSSPDTRPHRPDDQTDQTEGPVDDSARGIRVSGGLGLAQLPPQASGRLSNVSNTRASFGRDGLHLGEYYIQQLARVMQVAGLMHVSALHGLCRHVRSKLHLGTRLAAKCCTSTARGFDTVSESEV